MPNPTVVRNGVAMADGAFERLVRDAPLGFTGKWADSCCLVNDTIYVATKIVEQWLGRDLPGAQKRDLVLRVAQEILVQQGRKAA